MGWLVYFRLNESDITAVTKWNYNGRIPIDAAFAASKNAISDAVCLAHPLEGAPLAIVTDASDFALRAVGQQWVNDSWQLLAFFSRKLSPAEQKYSPYDNELLAIYASIRKLRYMVEGRAFTVFTDQ
jgi:hypothetical protein